MFFTNSVVCIEISGKVFWENIPHISLRSNQNIIYPCPQYNSLTEINSSGEGGVWKSSTVNHTNQTLLGKILYPPLQ